MKVFTLERRQFLPQTIERVFHFFSRAERLQQLTPEWLDFRIFDVNPPALGHNALIRYGLRWRILPIRWTTRIVRWEPPFRFVDEQISGPYRLWRHEHRFVRQGSGTLMYDTVRYALPFGGVGLLVQRWLVGRDVERIFDYRAQRVSDLFG